MNRPTAAVRPARTALVPPDALAGWQSEINRADEFERRLLTIRRLHAETFDGTGEAICAGCADTFPCVTALVAAGALAPEAVTA